MEQDIFPHVACLQMSLQQGDVEANLKEFNRLFDSDRFPADTLLVLPELWATGFDYPNRETLAKLTPDILAELQQKAARHGLWFAGSLLDRQDTGVIYNSLFLVGPEGVVGSYQKQHLFRLWQEDQYLAVGPSAQAMQTDFGALAALVCYDLRFPELGRRQIFSGCKLLIVSAQWPAVRSDHWEILLRARAVENQCLVVACNASGSIPIGELAGCSMIISPTGQVLAKADEKPALVRADLDAADVTTARSRFCSVAERPWYGQDRDKIVTQEMLFERVARLRAQGSRVVFTNGCFDLLHAGHVSYLEEARRCGDCLVIGLNSDRSVQALKGSARPVNPELERARVLAALGCVDFVVLFDEDTPLNLISKLLPDILVKGADWPEEQIAGAAEVKAAGGRIVRIPFTCQNSTTTIIEKIRTVASE
ncbi:MAG: D-glycero-beta-D-manno-heptose 1-phosphate adenylyltransferase [Candidatus Electrothrix sp. AUS4]|nr:D-glycero-beta-D-manno-heptose 1-phosphate adenylyltransferase [Candidatus Electrothrix sp. AUS4]